MYIKHVDIVIDIIINLFVYEHLILRSRLFMVYMFVNIFFYKLLTVNICSRTFAYGR